MAPVRFCLEAERAQLFREFLHQPGIWEALLQDLEEVKAMSVEAPASEDEFQPLCESSRLSIASPRVPLISTKGLTGSPLPPMSPRTPRTPEPTSDSAASPFFLERNIDQIPERNLPSPRTPETSVRVAVIQETPTASCLRPNIVQSAADRDPSIQDSVKLGHLKKSNQKVALPKDNSIASDRNVESLQSHSLLIKNVGEETLADSSFPSDHKVSEILAGITIEHQVSSPSPSLTTPVQSVHQYARKTTPFRSVVPRVESSTSPDSISPEPDQGSESPNISCLPPLLSSLPPVQVLPPALVSAVQKVFSRLPGNTVTASTAEPLCRVLDLPVLLDSCLLHSVFGKKMEGGCVQMLSFWQQHSNLMLGKSRLFHLIKGCQGSRSILKATDFTRLVRRLLSYHPQLEFFWCDSHSGMHAPYINSVVASMLWHAGGWRRGEINLRQFSSLNLEAILDMLQDPSQDLNLVPHFSYDQFYVAYVKFVHLDTSACGSLGPMELMDFEGGGQVGHALVERVFSRILLNCPMQFSDWVFFLLAQVDTVCRSALDYWFTVLDTDDDGFLCLGELQPFYKDAVDLLTSCGVGGLQVVSWDHLASQLLDTTGPPNYERGWSRAQLRANAKIPHLINAFINIFRFFLEDENDVVIRSTIPPIEKYVAKALQDMEGY